MPLLWPKFSSNGIHKTNDDPNLGHAEIECETDNILIDDTRYFDNDINKNVTDSSEGHLNISSSNFGALD